MRLVIRFVWNSLWLRHLVCLINDHNVIPLRARELQYSIRVPRIFAQNSSSRDVIIRLETEYHSRVEYSLRE